MVKNNSTNVDENNTEIQDVVIYIDRNKLDGNPNNPFRVVDDEKMMETVDSVKQYGVLMPLLVRKKQNENYEIVAGHRRKRACELAEVSKLPCIVRQLTDEEATIIMVDSNIQRENLLPSEKAFAYKMKLDALKHQGKRTDLIKELTSDQVGPKLERANEQLVSVWGDSISQIKRYIRLTYLIPDLLKLVDEGRIAFNPAVELSYLTRIEQEYVYDTIQCIDATPSYSQAQKMKKLSQNNKLTMEEIDNILSEEKPNQSLKYNLAIQRFSNYLPRNVVTPKEVEDYVLKCVIACKEKGIQIDKINIPLPKAKTKDKGAR